MHRFLIALVYKEELKFACNVLLENLVDPRYVCEPSGTFF